MMNCFDELYDRISRIDISDILGESRGIPKVVSNPAQLLLDDEKQRMTLPFLKDTALSYEKMSDYERFSLFVSNLAYMSGSGASERFCEELKLLFGYDVSVMGASAERIWKTCSDVLESVGYNAEELFKKRGIRGDVRPDVFSLELKHRYTRSYLDYSDEICAEISYHRNKTVFCDISGIDFIRTDIYHCEEAYRAFASGRGYAKEMGDTLMCGVLYSVCESLKNQDRELWLYVGENIASAKRMLGYFSERGVLPFVRVIASEPFIKSGAQNLSSVSSRVRVGLVYEASDTERSIARKITDIAETYPVGLLRYGGIMIDLPFADAARNIVKRGVCRALLDICDDADTAFDVAKRIFS